MSLTEKLTEIKNTENALLKFANRTTGEEDTRLGDAILRLADGFGSGGSSGVTYTEVTKLLAGRSFSIPIEGKIVAVVLDIHAPTSVTGGLGYNKQVKNLGLVTWANSTMNKYIILVDNEKMKISGIGAEGTNRTLPVTTITGVITSIQPHWINETEVTGGYYTVRIK